ncbi:hypothetical protein TELCIR_09304 [Teladorsagia circumcincta]|uniref:Uncharacterized protein n=1 Tax=Teladorsagia circumcincta TaxID=45464 RepID=A0A2G9UGM2_TELCI|nr:hypothetical protein TELCIR_09304 [Teladorsagia circumcincta]
MAEKSRNCCSIADFSDDGVALNLLATDCSKLDAEVKVEVYEDADRLDVSSQIAFLKFFCRIPLPLVDSCALQLLHVLILDQFNDFVSGRTATAPVRETCAQALGHFLRKTDSERQAVILAQLRVLLLMQGERNWHCRQSALLVFKYFFAVATSSSGFHDCFNLVVKSLDDTVDDVLIHREKDDVYITRKIIAAKFLATIIHLHYESGIEVAGQSVTEAIQLLFVPFLRSNLLYHNLGAAVILNEWAAVYRDSLNNRVAAFLASALFYFGFAPEKLTPMVRPLVECMQNEQNSTVSAEIFRGAVTLMIAYSWPRTPRPYVKVCTTFTVDQLPEFYDQFALDSCESQEVLICCTL